MYVGALPEIVGCLGCITMSLKPWTAMRETAVFRHVGVSLVSRFKWLAQSEQLHLHEVWATAVLILVKNSLEFTIESTCRKYKLAGIHFECEILEGIYLTSGRISCCSSISRTTPTRRWLMIAICSVSHMRFLLFHKGKHILITLFQSNAWSFLIMPKNNLKKSMPVYMLSCQQSVFNLKNDNEAMWLLFQ